jgi:benzoyl-CoA reductase/2-hydroxyglutaryl-CoA dehydratase subunit BcrC/BadD/HgdB
MAGAGVANLCHCPGFYVDHPFRGNRREALYYAGEMAEMVSFLEELTGHRMDMEKLSRALRLSGDQIALQREIYRLGQTVPSPVVNRRSLQLQTINWLYMGTPQGVQFCRAVLGELKSRAAQGLGAASREKYRLLGLFPPPIHAWKVVDWMQQEHGANLVAQPFTARWGEWEPDPAHPYLSIAQRSYAIPYRWTLHGPMDEAVVQEVLHDARSFQVDGVIYWASIGCSQGCAVIRRMKDAVTQELGLPFLIVDMEYADPTIVSHHEIMERLEGFFEVLGELRLN